MPTGASAPHARTRYLRTANPTNLPSRHREGHRANVSKEAQAGVATYYDHPSRRRRRSPSPSASEDSEADLRSETDSESGSDSSGSSDRRDRERRRSKARRRRRSSRRRAFNSDSAASERSSGSESEGSSNDGSSSDASSDDNDRARLTEKGRRGRRRKSKPDHKTLYIFAGLILLLVVMCIVLYFSLSGGSTAASADSAGSTFQTPSPIQDDAATSSNTSASSSDTTAASSDTTPPVSSTGTAPSPAAPAPTSVGPPSTGSVSTVDSSTKGYFFGASSYYVFALAQADRLAVLDALAGGGFKVVRIFVASVEAGNKGSNNVAVIEPSAVGSYDDTILTAIDQLMVDCKSRGLKLLIALHDRYALGFWSTDAYALSYSIVPAGSSGSQKAKGADVFYSNAKAIQSFDNRLTHALQHKNALMGNRPWAELGEVIYAFEAQNEPQGYVDPNTPTWVCDRSAHLKSLLPASSPILISSGGGTTLELSLESWATGCASIDVVSVHDYGASADNIVKKIQGAGSGKVVMLGEWGMTGDSKAANVEKFVHALKGAGIPWMYWEVTKPGKGAEDFEVWTDDPAWKALANTT